LAISTSAFASEIKCKVTSTGTLTGLFELCIGKQCGPNSVSAEITRTYNLSIDDVKTKDEVRPTFMNTSKDWAVTSLGLFNNEDEVRRLIEYGTTNGSSAATYDVNNGMVSIEQDSEFKTNHDQGIPKIVISNWGASFINGSKTVPGIPSVFDFTEPNNGGSFRLTHAMAIDCP